MLHDAKIRRQELAGLVGVHPHTVYRWWRDDKRLPCIPTRVRRYLELAIRVRQLESEVAKLQALLSDRSQAIDPIQD
jgi:transposase-like protein